MSQRAERFGRFVSPARQADSDCLLWTGAIASGYGIFWDGSRYAGAHRWAYEKWCGPIPPGLQVCHRCDTPTCVNVDHLFVGTPADNTHDAQSKGRLATGDRHGSRLHPGRLTPPTGERSGSAKLTWESVEEIRRLYARGGVTQQELATRFGVTLGTVNPIIKGRTWKYAPKVSGTPA